MDLKRRGLEAGPKLALQGYRARGDESQHPCAQSLQASADVTSALLQGIHVQLVIEKSGHLQTFRAMAKPREKLTIPTNWFPPGAIGAPRARGPPVDYVDKLPSRPWWIFTPPHYGYSFHSTGKGLSSP